MAGLGGHETRELINPLASTSQPAGALQQFVFVLVFVFVFVLALVLAVL